MENHIKVTVLMTVYNGGKYLPQAIKSVLDQTHKDFEFLIINDCSTDNTLEMIKSFDDERIVIHNNEVNKGQTRSLNIGFNIAKGDYVAFIDADDVAFESWIEEQVKFLKNNEGCDALSSGLVTIDPGNNIKKIYMSPEERDDIILKALIKAPINHGSAFVRREAVLSLGGYNERHNIAADYNMWIRFIRNNFKMSSNDKVLMAIRMHDESASKLSEGDEYESEVSEIMRDHIKFISSFDISDNDAVLLYRAHYSEGTLTDVEFRDALCIHSKIYEHINSSMNLDEMSMKNWKKIQVKTLFMRRIHSFFIKGDFKGARRLCSEAIGKFSILSIFSGLFVATLFKNLLLGFTVQFYDSFYRKKAIQRLGVSKIF